MPISLRAFAGLCAALLVVAVVFGAGSALGDDTLDPTSDQRKALNEHGVPPFWILADGPVAPGEPAHRIESWFYPATGQLLRFVDGKALAPTPFDGAGLPDYVLRVDPTRFHRELSRDDVAELLGESGVAVPGFKSPYEGSQAYFYKATGLLVTYLNGQFFTAQHHKAEGT